MGILHDTQRQLGLYRGGRQLEDTATCDSQPGAVRPRWRKLPAEHWAQAGWLRPRTERAHPEYGWHVDSEERRGYLHRRKGPLRRDQHCRIYAQEEYAVHARLLLAR